MKKMIYLTMAIFLVFGCSKKAGMTTSKIKIVGGKAFSGTLATKASNGLIFYGKSDNGKSFAKRIDVDTIDLTFPNGKWNFYAISWEFTPDANSALKGKVHCAKSESISLTGTDVTIDLILSNEKCADAAFSSAHKSISPSGEIVFPNRRIYSCKDVSSYDSATWNTASMCSSASGEPKTGYATSYKYIIPQYKNFGSGFQFEGEAFATACIPIDGGVPTGEATTSAISNHENSFRFPDAINGLMINVRAYYTASPCSEGTSYGVDDMVLPKENTPRTKSTLITNSPSAPDTYFTYLQTGDNEICRDSRLNTIFAGGTGTGNLPFVICNTTQFNNIGGSNFSSYFSNNFALAKDLDFNFGTFIPIGEPISNLAPTQAFTGNLEGNNHRISNILFKNTSGNQNGQYLGIVRYANSSNGKIQNLTINKYANMGYESWSYSGILAGKIVDHSLKNIRVFGHVEGASYVGGVAGAFYRSAGGPVHTNLHAEVGVKGTANIVVGNSGYAGGIFGYADGAFNLSKSSFRGSVEGSSKRMYLNVSSTLYNDVTVGTSYNTQSAQATGNFKVTNKLQNGATYWLEIEGPRSLHWAGQYIYPVPSGSALGSASPITNAVLYKDVGGIVGFFTGGTMSEVLSYGERISAEKNVGGLVGTASFATIENSKSESYVTSDHWGETTAGDQGNAGGAVGYCGDCNTNYIISLGYRKSTGDDSSAGGAIGKSVGITNFSSVYYYGNSSNSLGTLPATLLAARDKTTYSGFTYYTFYGTGAPSIGGTTNDTYMDLSNGNCYTHSGSNWTSGCSTTPWIQTANTLDFPRLSIEFQFQNTVPYLKRDCVDISFYQTTALTNSNGAKIICKPEQILAKSAGASDVDILGTNLYFKEDVLTTATPTKYAAGIYRLNGNGKRIYYIRSNGGSGLFSKLESGSVFTNAEITGVEIDYETNTIPTLGGVVAKENAGQISDIKIDGLFYKIDAIEAQSSDTYIGFLVGSAGYSTSQISKIRLQASGEMYAPYSQSVDFRLGGIAGKASGLIEKSKVDLQFKRTDGTSSASVSLTSYEKFGGVVGHANNLVLNQIEARTHYEASYTGATGTVNLSSGFAPLYGSSTESSAGSNIARDIYLEIDGFLSKQNAATSSGFNLDVYRSGNPMSLQRGFVILRSSSVEQGLTESSASNGYSAGTESNLVYVTYGTRTKGWTDSGFSFSKDGSGVVTASSTTKPTYAFSNWSYATSFLNTLGKTWLFDFENGNTTTDPPRLVATDGNFDEIGKGF